MKNQTQPPRGIEPETVAAFERIHAARARDDENRRRAEREALAAFDRIRAALARDAEVQQIAAMCAAVLHRCEEIEAIRAWREVAACTAVDPFDWSRGGRELPS